MLSVHGVTDILLKKIKKKKNKSNLKHREFTQEIILKEKSPVASPLASFRMKNSYIHLPEEAKQD